jgi:hypothetical protein
MESNLDDRGLAAVPGALTTASPPVSTRARARIRVIGLQDTAALAALSVVGIGIPLWLTAAAGAIGIPSNDAWVYMRGASSLFRTGSIDMPGHTAASVGQVVLVQPLLWLSGGDPWAFTAFGLLMGLIGVVSTYLLARRFVGVGSAVLVVLLVLAFPGFARETANFMTDEPAYALGILCLLLGIRWLQGDGGRLTLFASLGIGLLAVSIREFAVAAPVAILLAAWARNRANERTLLAIASGTFAAGLVAVLLVADAIPGRALPLGLGLRWPILLGPTFVTLAAVLLPASALAVGRRMATLSASQILGAIGVVFIAVALRNDLLIGNLWLPDGLAGTAMLLGTRDAVIPPLGWAVTEQLALFAAILAALLALRWGQRHLALVNSVRGAGMAAIGIARSREGPLLLFLVLYAGGLAVFNTMIVLVDRYLYLMVPPAAILLLREFDAPARLGRSTALSHAALVLLAASAFVIAANSSAYDAARYRAGEAAVALGYDAGTVDAGYEWVGLHASGAQVQGANAYGLMWYDDMWPSFRPCAVLSNKPLDTTGFVLIREDPAAYRQYLFVGPEEPLYLYGSTAAGCPAPPTNAGAIHGAGSG